MRKIIQIATSESTDDVTYLSLCNDGTVWEYEWAKPLYEERPANAEKPYSHREKIGMTQATWKKLADMPQEERYNEK